MELLHRSSSCLELTAASPSLPVHQSQSVSSTTQDSSFQAAAFHWLFLWKLLKSLNWTELNITRQLLCNVQLQAEHMSNLWSTGLNELSLFKQTAVDDRHERCVVAFKPLLSATQQVNCQPSVTQYHAYQHLTQCPVRGHALYPTLSVNCCTFISSFAIFYSKLEEGARLCGKQQTWHKDNTKHSVSLQNLKLWLQQGHVVA